MVGWSVTWWGAGSVGRLVSRLVGWFCQMVGGSVGWSLSQLVGWVVGWLVGR